MKILIDIGHPAHVHYFRNFIRLMQNKGHEFFISARDKEVTHLLLQKYNIPYFNRGTGSPNLIGKLAYLAKADLLLLRKAKIFKPDILLSFASPYAAHVAKYLNKPHIAFTDTENAKLGILSFAPFTKCIITPASFKKDFGVKHVKFKGFMELCYLHPNRFSPDYSILSEMGISGDEPYSILRFVSWGANHDIGQSGFSDKSKVQIVKGLSKRMKVYISSEGNIPKEIIQYKLSISPERIHDLLSFATLYIGEGATMASECAMLGTPAIYVNSLNAGTIEEQERLGLLYNFRNEQYVLENALDLLKMPDLKNEFRHRRDTMLAQSIDVTEFMCWFIVNFPDSLKIAKETPVDKMIFRY
jgi:uncharacterized protein